MVRFLLCLHDMPSSNKLRAIRDKVLAYTVGILVDYFQRIHDVRDMEPPHDRAGQHLVIRLLPDRAAAALHEQAFTVHDNPFLLRQPSVVLSGDIRLNAFLSGISSNRMFPTSSENGLSKRLMSSHHNPESSGHTQY